MKTSRFWIEIVGLGTAIACALALVIATLGAAAAAVGGHPKSEQAKSEQAQAEPAAESPSAASLSLALQQTHEGMVTCSRCGAKHSATLGRTAVDCSITCVRAGATFALVDGDKTYMLDGASDRLKKVAGRRARIMGSVRGNRINVSSVAASS
jgi:hypothetical protein